MYALPATIQTVTGSVMKETEITIFLLSRIINPDGKHSVEVFQSVEKTYP